MSLALHSEAFLSPIFGFLILDIEGMTEFHYYFYVTTTATLPRQPRLHFRQIKSSS